MMKEEDIVKRSVTMIVLFPGTNIYIYNTMHTNYVEVFKHHWSSFHSNEYGYLTGWDFFFFFFAFAIFKSIETEILFDWKLNTGNCSYFSINQEKKYPVVLANSVSLKVL